jgi:Flp pilus assembly protein TadD
MQPLLAHLSFEPRNTPAIAMLAVLREGRDGKSLTETVAKLRAAADRYPYFLPLQVAAARAHLKAGEPNKAEQVARRAAASFPEDTDAVRLLASVYAASGKLAELREAALLWRRLSPRDTLEAELLLARVQLNVNDTAGAADRLQAHARAEAAKAMAGDESAAAEVIDLYARALIAQGNATDAAALLEPLAQKSPVWRRLWLDLAGAFRRRDREAAATWIARIEPSVPNDAHRERAWLASAWYVVGREFDDRGSLQTARAIAEPLTSDDAVAAEAWTLLASCDEGLGNLDPAEGEYRKALQLRPGHGDIMNNLAYVLLLKGDAAGLAEAKELAGKAVAAAPGVAGYYDTLARIEAQLGPSDAAVTHFRKALELDAASLEAMIGLADVLWRTGRREEARQQLAQIETALKDSPRLPALLNKQLEKVRASLQNPVESGRVE